jgi:hypothetical protein
VSAALAVGKSVSDAQLLAELLTVPNNPYRIAVHGNVLVLYRSPEAAILPVIFGCK